MTELLKRKIDYLKNKGYKAIYEHNNEDKHHYASDTCTFTKKASDTYDVEFIITYNEVENAPNLKSSGCYAKINSTLNPYCLNYINDEMKDVEIDAEVIREDMTRDKKASELGYHKTRSGEYEKFYDDTQSISILLNLKPYTSYPVFIRNKCNLYAEKLDELKKVLDKASEDRKLLLKYPVEL